MDEEFSKLSPEERLQIENNLLRLKIKNETGGDFFKNEEHRLDPLIENQFLNNIYEFEKQFNCKKQTTVYQFIGNPVFKNADQLKEHQLEDEMRHLNEILNKNGINLDFICEYDALTQYKFITEELFAQEIDDIRVPGMMTCFTYEEFHPNHEYDLKRHTHDFLEALFNRAWSEFDEYQLSKELFTVSNQPITNNDFVQNIELFQNTWEKFDILKDEIVKVEFNIETAIAKVEFYLSYKAGVKTSDSTVFSGNSCLHFIYQYDFWCINKINIPGLEF